MGARMAKPYKARRPLDLEVAFEVGRGSKDAVERAYERLLPSLTHSFGPRARGPSGGAHHEEPAPANCVPSSPAGG